MNNIPVAEIEQTPESNLDMTRLFALNSIRLAIMNRLLQEQYGEAIESMEQIRLERDNAVQERDTALGEARTDQLTGLPNSKSFYEVLPEVLSNSSKVAVLNMDLNKFKNLNDTHGHNEGDKALKLFGDILTHEVVESKRPNDQAYIFRKGGDEFMAIVVLGDSHVANGTESSESTQNRNYTKSDTEELAGYANRISQMLDKTTRDTKMDGLGVSIGIALFRDTEYIDVDGNTIDCSNETQEEFINRSDTIMYKAKREP